VIVIPEETPLTEPYWAAAKAGRLVVQECQECGRSWHPPQPSCPYCMSDNYLWRQVAPSGSVLSYTVVRQAAHAAVKESVPYIVALITVEPGITVICNILQADPADVRIGTEVELRLGRTPGGIELVEAFLVDLCDPWTRALEVTPLPGGWMPASVGPRSVRDDGLDLDLTTQRHSRRRPAFGSVGGA
jgi:uncharacterized protein